MYYSSPVISLGGEKMPLYEYRCRRCRSRLEMLQRVNEQPLKTCPKCGGELERLVSPAAIRFKGSGWYVTDYGRANQGNSQSSGNGKDREAHSKESEPAAPKTTKEASPSKPDSSD
jgi:putative FmdB family regulatory protein